MLSSSEMTTTEYVMKYGVCFADFQAITTFTLKLSKSESKSKHKHNPTGLGTVHDSSMQPAIQCLSTQYSIYGSLFSPANLKLVTWYLVLIEQTNYALHGIPQ